MYESSLSLFLVLKKLHTTKSFKKKKGLEDGYRLNKRMFGLKHSFI